MADAAVPAGSNTPTPRGNTVTFYDEKFTLQAHPNEFALMQFAAAAEDADVSGMAAMGAAFRLLQAAIIEEDWSRFKQAAFNNRATIDDLMPVMFAVFEQVTDRPTEQPAVSSVGPSPSPATSGPEPDASVTDLLSGRPDLQLAFDRSRQASQAISA